MIRRPAALVLAVTSAPALADDAAPARPELAEAVEAVARRFEDSPETAVPRLSLFGRSEIERRGSLFVDRVLEEAPGLFVLTDGSRGQQSRIYLRGAAPTQTLVLVDGIPQNDATTGGGYDFRGLTTDAVDRIEVLAGSYGILYGSEAMGGVVSVTTARAEGPPRGFFRAGGGSHGAFDASAGASGGDGSFSFGAWGGAHASDGDGRREDSRSVQGGARMGAALTDRVRADWTLRAAETENESPLDFPGFGATTVPADRNIDRREDTLSTGVTFTADHEPWLRTRLALSFFRVESEFTNGSDGVEVVDPDFVPGSGDEIRVVRDEFLADNRSEDLRARLATTANLAQALGWSGRRGGGADVDLTAGFEHLRQDSRSAATFPDFGAPTSTTSVTDRDTRTRSFFGLAEMKFADAGPFGGPVVSFGARHDDHDVFGGEASGHAGFRAEVLATGTLVRGAWGEGFRAPKPVELDDPSVGNAALGPETSESFDLGVTQDVPGVPVTAGVTWFRLDTEDLIAFDASATSPSRPFGQLVNVGEARTEGFEWELRADLGGGFGARGTWTKQNPRDRATGLPLPNRPRDFGSAGLSFERGDVACDLSFAWSGKFPNTGGEFTDPDGDARRAPGRRGILDLCVRWRATDALAVVLRAENLLDDDWVATPTAPAGPGRGAWLGIELDF